MLKTLILFAKLTLENDPTFISSLYDINMNYSTKAKTPLSYVFQSRPLLPRISIVTNA